MTDYSFPYLFVQNYGYPFSSLPLVPVESAIITSPPSPDTPAPVEDPALDPEAQPDALVQDVQAELTRRGYFTGKATGIVTKAFQAALLRFQTDERLVSNGLINQATLYALGLN